MVLAVDAGHQMKKRKSCYLYVFNHYRWYDLQITSLGMEKFHKRIWCNRNKGVVYFSLLIKMVIVSRLLILQSNLHEKRQLNRNKGKWFMSESSLPSYSVAEVQAGFKAHPDLLIRTEVIYEADGQP
jgi:cytochrome c oxidase subunit 3